MFHLESTETDTINYILSDNYKVHALSVRANLLTIDQQLT